MTNHDPLNDGPATLRGWCRAGAGAALLASAMLLAACGPDIERRPQTARPAGDTHENFGDLEVHYNAVRTDQLRPEIARAYGIERSATRVLLNVAMLAKQPDGAAVPVDGEVTATARTLVGHVRKLAMRRVQEGAAVYFIGEVGITGEEMLVFDIEVVPISGGGRRAMQFQREFFDD